ncbi:MAG: lipopolysaccharide assembly protein LapB [Gammaproteobacteria bacterium]|nr:lipopolysaccharide assembly protein LapB [Gammaproteobacteria bacterium]
MDSISFYVLVLVAVIASWLLGRLSVAKSSREKKPSSALFQNYFVGLNYLFNDEPDEAIDTFIRALEINSETIETHLALGALLRRRGKVDKAINVHQALLARPNLEPNFTNSVRLQLALNYISAGLLDRAERLLQEVLEDGAEAKWDALTQLITIYQAEKEWEKAIASSTELLKRPRHKKDVELLGSAAHFCCELAEQYLQNNHDLQARAEIKRAFTFERKSVRAMLLLADIEQHEGNYKAAIKELLRIRAAKPEFIPQLLARMKNCYKHLGSEDELEKLLKAMVADDSSTEAALLLARITSQKSGNNDAIELLQRHLERFPSLTALIELLDLQLGGVDEDVATGLKSLLNLVEAQAQKSSEYQCHHCGFETKSFFWMCPSCKKWDKIHPITVLPSRQTRIINK